MAAPAPAPCGCGRGSVCGCGCGCGGGGWGGTELAVTGTGVGAELGPKGSNTTGWSDPSAGNCSVTARVLLMFAGAKKQLAAF